MNLIIGFLSFIAVIGESIVITRPALITDLEEYEQGIVEGSEDNPPTLVQRFFMIISLLQLPLIPLLLFSGFERFQVYGGVFLVFSLIGILFRRHIVNNMNLILFESAVEIVILVEIIRSCIFSVLI